MMLGVNEIENSDEIDSPDLSPVQRSFECA